MAKISTVTQIFTEHPSDVGETYFEHFGAALRYSGLLIVAGSAALVHAIVPALCKTTAGRIVNQIAGEIAARHSAP